MLLIAGAYRCANTYGNGSIVLVLEDLRCGRTRVGGGLDGGDRRADCGRGTRRMV
jgi:hypothetical protein